MSAHTADRLVLSDAELLERLRRVRGLEASLLAELRARNVEPPIVPECAHPDRPVASMLDTAHRPACFECVRESHGIKPRDEDAAREAQADFAAHFGLLPDSEDLRTLRVVGGER